MSKINIEFIPMPLLPTTLAYPSAENSKLEALGQLFQEWMNASIQAAPEMKEQIQGMVFDGFYPHYFGKKPKMLFIGREALDIEGCNYLDQLHGAYRTTKDIGGRHLNTSQFHRRMIHTAYGLLNGLPEWKDIPDADQIGDSFATAEGISFAFMNLSKFSNESGFWPSNWKMIQDAVRLATQGRSFIAEEIALLEPEIVITMNLEDYFPALGEKPEHLGTYGDDCVSAWKLNSHGHKSLLLDTFHFTAFKRDLEHFYQPICEAVKTHIA